ncbi:MULTISPECIES: hypothetical protein [Microbacterium]|uniref:hypothetical protein n=1 Tax=Microbacterium TaxID=33882 RepID=UPI000B944C4E|nr:MULTISPECIES: hypothetical protein [Microbacterium]MDQ1216132.1 hypothetical protein [Microbacterium arborescens]OYC95143.1 hypothetical protein CI089_10315 [Microbacterium sp. Yaish 1]
MHIAGLDADIIDALAEVATTDHRPDALTIGVSLPDAPDELPACIDEVDALLERELSRVSPRILVAVVHAAGRLADGRVFASELIDHASVHSSNSLGRDLTAVGIVLDDEQDRALVARRIAEHLSGRSNLGDGTVVTAHDLRRSTLRDLILEDVL